MVGYYQNNLHNVIEVEHWAYELIKKEGKNRNEYGSQYPNSPTSLILVTKP